MLRCNLTSCRIQISGNTLQSDGGMSTEINKRTQCGWNNWRKMSGVLCDKRVPPHVKGKIHKMIVQLAMLYRIETVPVTSSHMQKMEVAEMKMCRWAYSHTLTNDDIRERLKVENITERCRKTRQMIWAREETRPRIGPTGYIERKTLEIVPPGRSRRGRPKQSLTSR